jgi:DNA polymerase
LLQRNVPPERVVWQPPGAQTELFGDDAPSFDTNLDYRPPVPRAYFELAEQAVYHRSPQRYDALYRLLYRLVNGEPELLEVASDPEVSRVRSLSQAVRRDVHKTHAFVRFRRVESEEGERFVAWHRPDHPILELAAPFFRDRFPNMCWSILTPDESCYWDGQRLLYGPGAPRSAAPESDELEELFLTYYRSIFNPARLNLPAMQAEMPAKHWSTLPEARVMGELMRESPERVREMLEAPKSAAQAFLPRTETLPELTRAAKSCEACPLHEPATQVVFGEGPDRAELMLVGEQPGDEEDLQGRPFVGPAGKVLDEALAQAGISRAGVYVTNAVKHFKFEPRGKRRLHQRPRVGEVVACRAWLDAELRVVKPRVIVCLGNTAAQSFVGSRFNLQRYRGRIFQQPWAEAWLATYHPAAILRAPTAEARAETWTTLVADLRKARAFLLGELATPTESLESR